MYKYLKLIGIIFFIYIVYILDYTLLWEAVIKVNPMYLALSCVVYLITIAIKSYRWKLLVISQSSSIAFSRCFFLTLYIGFIANVTPGRIGELFKLKYLKELDFSTIKAITNLTLDRLSDLVMMLFLSLTVAFLYISDSNYAVFIAISVIVFLIALILMREIYGHFLKRLKINVRASIESFFDEFRKIDLAYFIISIFFTVIGIINIQFQVYLIALGLNIRIDFITFFQAMLVANLIALIPVSISGLGTRELVLINLLARNGISAEVAALISLIDLVLVAYIFNGFLALFIRFFKKQLLPEIA